MGAFFKAFADRVFRSYKSTLVGLGIGVGLIAIEVFVAGVPVDAPSWLKALAGFAVLVGSALRSKALPPAQP